MLIGFFFRCNRDQLTGVYNLKITFFVHVIKVQMLWCSFESLCMKISSRNVSRFVLGHFYAIRSNNMEISEERNVDGQMCDDELAQNKIRAQSLFHVVFEMMRNKMNHLDAYQEHSYCKTSN